MADSSQAPWSARLVHLRGGIDLAIGFNGCDAGELGQETSNGRDARHGEPLEIPYGVLMGWFDAEEAEQSSDNGFGVDSLLQLEDVRAWKWLWLGCWGSKDCWQSQEELEKGAHGVCVCRKCG